MLIHVAVPVPSLGLLTYRVPENLPRPPVGARVVVPLGSRTVTGIVMDDAPETTLAAADVKPVTQVLRETLPVTASTASVGAPVRAN